MFSIHTKKFENTAITGQFGIVFEEHPGRAKNIIFEKLCLQNLFQVHKNAGVFQITPV